jgi:hypothetical protein
MVLANGQAVAREIQVGTSDERTTQVVAGLEEGDQVIVGQTVTGGTTATPNRQQNNGGLLPSGPGGGPRPGGR